MRGNVTGEQYAQVDNQDPFASPVWRSPVHRTPETIIWIVQLARLLVRVAWFLIRHPLLDTSAGIVVLAWEGAGWRGVIGLAVFVAGNLAALRIWWPDWFSRFVAVPVRCRWRWWFYRRHWHAVMTIAGLAPLYRGHTVLPVLGKVQAGPCTDRVPVRLVSGQSPMHFADRADSVAHGFGAHVCRVRAGRPGSVVLELVRRDALAEPMPALPIPAATDLRALRSASARTECRSRSGCTVRIC
jgi:DNA segregation ATPase FtsK/SpoIIIE, S-DNA-T family